MEAVRIYIQEQESVIAKAIGVMRAEERRLTPPKQLMLLQTGNAPPLIQNDT